MEENKGKTEFGFEMDPDTLKVFKKIDANHYVGSGSVEALERNIHYVKVTRNDSVSERKGVISDSFKKKAKAIVATVVAATVIYGGVSLYKTVSSNWDDYGEAYSYAVEDAKKLQEQGYEINVAEYAGKLMADNPEYYHNLAEEAKAKEEARKGR